MEGDKVREFLQFQIRRKVTNLYKNFLFILEDLKSEQYNMPDEVYQRHRKRVLDHGNDAIREIEECLNNLEIKIK
jgi:hypothetical protein|tara:strand:+ start:1143 stop:1367 length:225 start_codon:yes stop_codon:yes gene_type:complete